MMGQHSLLVLLFSLAVIASVRCDEQNIYIQVLKEVEQDLSFLIAPPDKNDYYNRYLDAVYGILDGLNFGELYQALASGTHDNKTCQQCNEIVILGKQLLQTPEIVTVFGKAICKSVGNSAGGTSITERVCDGLLERLAVPLVYMLQNTELDFGEQCAMLLHPDCMTHLGRHMTDKVLWELPIPAKRAAFRRHPKAGDGKPMKAMHISDLHFDQFYTEGANAACDEPLCCRSTSNGHNISSGPWGSLDGDCDTPVHSGLTYISQLAKAQPDLDFLLWTGDSTAHDVWNTSQEVNLKNVKMISDQIKKEFKNTVVIPALGNHEAHPINLFVPSNVPKSSGLNMSWLYDTLADDYWSQWLGEPQKKTFKVGGYYSKIVKPNLKVLVLNTNACDRENYWIMYNSKDANGQLKWLIEELHDSETKGIHTFMIGHVPPSECYLSWFNNYIRIVDRFHEVIVGNYFGHTHKEELFIYENKDKSGKTYPLTHVYIGGSITTYTALNPSYKVYELDANGRAQDFTTYYTDVNADNARGLSAEPVWKPLYSAKSEYGLTDLSTKSWDQFITRAKTDDTLTNKYYKNYHRNSVPYVRSHSEDNMERKRKNLQDKKILNAIFTMLPPIRHN